MTPSQIAYEFWAAASQHPLRPWSSLPAGARALWEGLAQAVLKARP